MSWDWDKLKQQQQSRGGGPPPQMDEILDKLKKFKLPGGPLLILVIAIILIAATTFYTVKQDEVGIVQRFGRYIKTTQPGLNFKLPIGIEKVTKVNVKQIRTEEFGFSSARTDIRSRFKSGSENISVALMLTGDLNVAVVPWIVQYRVKNPYDYLVRVRNVRGLLIDRSEASMRLVVGDRFEPLDGIGEEPGLDAAVGHPTPLPDVLAVPDVGTERQVAHPRLLEDLAHGPFPR